MVGNRVGNEKGKKKPDKEILKNRMMVSDEL